VRLVYTTRPRVAGVLHMLWSPPTWALLSSTGCLPQLGQGSPVPHFTRPHISYAIQQVCLHMHDPCEPHLTTAKHILRYLEGTLDYGLLLHRASTSEIIVYTGTHWVGCPDTRRFTLGYVAFLVSWSSNRHNIVSHGQRQGVVVLASSVTGGVAQPPVAGHSGLLR
jgi:hypothetical protein